MARRSCGPHPRGVRAPRRTMAPDCEREGRRPGEHPPDRCDDLQLGRSLALRGVLLVFVTAEDGPMDDSTLEASSFNQTTVDWRRPPPPIDPSETPPWSADTAAIPWAVVALPILTERRVGHHAGPSSCSFGHYECIATLVREKSAPLNNSGSSSVLANV